MAVTLTDGEAAEVGRALGYWRQTWHEPEPFTADLTSALAKLGVPVSPRNLAGTSTLPVPPRLRRRGEQ